jgi:DNA-binding PadR family transcriptional regulator
MIPLYILGLLQRFGPQHGYQLKKTITEQLSDFTQIKLPTIYYHLDKMEADNLLIATSEKPGSRPAKRVYSVTDKGIQAFQEMLTNLLEFDYRPTFPSDGLFYFSDFFESNTISENLNTYIKKLTKIIDHIEKHQKETLEYVPTDAKIMVTIIFNHHLQHYYAELNWVNTSLEQLNQKEQ